MGSNRKGASMSNIMTEEEIIEREIQQRKLIKKMRRERPFDDEPQKKKKEPKPKKEKIEKVKKEKVVKTEAELVQEYVGRIINGKKSRGHVDERFAYTKADGTVNKEMWRDVDFFFSVVFQSKAQKYEFMEFIEEKFGFEFDEEIGHQIQIVNGFKLSGVMGHELKPEKAMPYPYGSLDLKPLVLDEEAL